MPELQDFAYWIALAHLPNWRTERVNKLIVGILHNRKLSLAEFFDLGESDWQNEFQSLNLSQCVAIGNDRTA